MRKWVVSLAVLGVGGLSWLLFAARGQRAGAELAAAGPAEELERFNRAVQLELARIQAAVDQVAASLRTAES